MTTYILIEWPWVQELMSLPGFNDHACLANDERFLLKNTTTPSSAYFVEAQWAKANGFT